LYSICLLMLCSFLSEPVLEKCSAPETTRI
jgi:hypothetical protein